MEIALTKMSSKGQIVIPSELRKDIKEGDKIIIIKGNNQLVLKKASSLDKQLKEDLEFSKRIKAAWKEIDEGKGITMDFDEFLTKAKKW